MASDKKVLVDFASAIRLTLQESDEGGKFLYARGEFGRADVPTQNRRTYPRKVWQREISRIQEAIKAGKVLGHLEHPSTGKTSLEKVSHIITGLEMQDDGTIVGEAKILNNEYGRQLRSILEAGGAVGVSSRGLGSTMMGEDGMEVVQDDYSYMTHDFVADPAVITSYPKFQTEVRWIEPKSVVVEKKEQEMEKEMKAVEKEEKPEAPEAEQEMSVEELKDKLATMLKDKEAKAMLDQLVDAAKEEGEKEAEEEAKEEKKAEGEEESDESPATQEMPMGENKHNNSKLDHLIKRAQELEDMHEDDLTASEKEELKDLGKEIESEKRKMNRGRTSESESVSNATKAITMEEIKKLLMPYILPEETEAALAEERTKVAALTKQVAELTESVDKLGATCNRLGVALYFEKSMKRMPENDQNEVAAIVGDLKKYEDVRSLEKTVMEAKKVIGARRLEEAAKRKEIEAQQAKFKALEEEHNKKLADIEARNKKLEAQLKESLEQSKALGIRVYLEERVKDHPSAAQIRRLCEGKTTKEEVDAIIKRHSVMPVTSEDYTSVRRRFDKFKNTQLVESHVKETAPAVSKKRDVVTEGVDGEMVDLFPGVSLDQIKNLM